MRTASEIAIEGLVRYTMEEEGITENEARVALLEDWSDENSKKETKVLFEIINTARKEAIEECMIIAWEQMTLGHPEFIKESISNLIKELK